jgi:hypothetical protein
MQENLTDAYYYRIRIAQKLDPENKQWLGLAPAQKIVEYLGDKQRGDLKAAEERHLAISYMLLTVHAFNQQPDGTGNCPAAIPYLQKALEFNPEDAFLLELKDYCAPD